MTRIRPALKRTCGLALMGAAILTWTIVPSAADDDGDVDCPVTRDLLSQALSNAAPDGADNGGLDNEMWASAVNRDGVVCAVTRTGELNSQWPASRVISAQKATTAWSLSLDEDTGGTVDSLSTANLWAATQPGGSLWELTQSNPVDTKVAYKGKTNKYGTTNDPLVGEKLGGINVFGGGLALYDGSGDRVGGVGVSGDTSCADHNVAWRVRDFLGLDDVPSGVAGADKDNIKYDLESDTPSGFGHPECGFGERQKNVNVVNQCPPNGATDQTCTDLGSN